MKMWVFGSLNLLLLVLSVPVLWKKRTLYGAILRQVRWWMFPAVVPLAAGSIGLIWGTFWLLPFTKWGWLGMNMLFSSSGMLPTSLWPFKIMILLLALAVLPPTVHWEERTFRQEVLQWKGILRSSFFFAFLHLVLAGVPIAFLVNGTAFGVVMCLLWRRKYRQLLAQEGIGLKPDGTLALSIDGPLAVDSTALSAKVRAIFIFTDYARDTATYHTAILHLLYDWILILFVIGTIALEK